MVRCLVVDDDELGRELIASYLEGIADCEMAENGLKAVEMFRDAFEGGNPYDLIILDIVMPEMDGHTAAKEIRMIEKEWGVPINNGVNIVVLSSLNTPSDVIQAYVSARSAAHLVKPVQPDKLLAILGKLGMRGQQ
ncbi:MAG: response regulator [Deltaproteobacteria bacterium]|nr:response regulator [Deltaproteobacteria bacterium]